jgi:hypothetical protein
MVLEMYLLGQEASASLVGQARQVCLEPLLQAVVFASLGMVVQTANLASLDSTVLEEV